MDSGRRWSSAGNAFKQKEEMKEEPGKAEEEGQRQGEGKGRGME